MTRARRVLFFVALMVAIAFTLGYAAGRADGSPPSSAAIHATFVPVPRPPAGLYLFQPETGAPSSVGEQSLRQPSEPGDAGANPAAGAPGAPSPTMPAAMGSTSPAASSATVSGITASGVASTYGPGYDGYLALPGGPGIRVRICGAGGCIVRVSNDAGPDLAMQRLGRIVDLGIPDFEIVCGASWRIGLCHVTVEYLTSR